MSIIPQAFALVLALQQRLTKEEQLEIMDCPMERLATTKFPQAEKLCRVWLRKDVALRESFHQAGISCKEQMVLLLIWLLRFHLKTCYW